MIDYSRLESGDVVLVRTPGIIPAIIRWVTRCKDSSDQVATHCGIIIDIWGQKLIAEMTPAGLQLNSLERYLTRSHGSILGIGRLALTRLDRAEICKRIARDCRKSIEYDWTGNLAFLTGLFSEDDSRAYCSEYVVETLAEAQELDSLETKQAGRVSPEDLYLFFTSRKHLVNWQTGGDNGTI